MMLDELFEKYLDDIDLTHSLTTIDSIKYRYNKHISPVFGKEDISKINPERIRKFQRELYNGKRLKDDKTKYSITFINIIIQLLKRLIKYANIRHYISLSKADIDDIDMIKDIVDKYKFVDSQVIWTLNDFNKFISCVDDMKYKVLFSVLFFCGLRKGEVLALKWKNIDFIDETLTVNSTASKVIKQGQIVKAPKTKNSYRTIYLNESLKKLLLEYYFVQKKKYMNLNEMFVFGGNKMISFSTLDRNFNKYLEISKVKKMNLHGFRHSHATFCLSISADIYSVSKRLGHESISITETYLHSSSLAQKELARKIEQEVKKISVVHTFCIFKENLEKILLRELENELYNVEEVEKIIKIYNYVREVFKCE